MYRSMIWLSMVCCVCLLIVFLECLQVSACVSGNKKIRTSLSRLWRWKAGYRVATMFIVELGISPPPIGNRRLDPPATEIQRAHAYSGRVRHKGGWAEVLRVDELSHLLGPEM